MVLHDIERLRQKEDRYSAHSPDSTTGTLHTALTARQMLAFAARARCRWTNLRGRYDMSHGSRTVHRSVKLYFEPQTTGEGKRSRKKNLKLPALDGRRRLVKSTEPRLERMRDQGAEQSATQGPGSSGYDRVDSAKDALSSSQRPRHRFRCAPTCHDTILTQHTYSMLTPHHFQTFGVAVLHCARF